MQVIINTNNIVFSSDGTNPDRVIERASISSIRRVAIPGAAGFNPSMPANKQSAYKVELTFNDGEKFMFDIQDVTNHPDWTANDAGLNNAVNQMKS